MVNDLQDLRRTIHRNHLQPRSSASSPLRHWCFFSLRHGILLLPQLIPFHIVHNQVPGRSCRMQTMGLLLFWLREAVVLTFRLLVPCFVIRLIYLLHGMLYFLKSVYNRYPPDNISHNAASSSLYRRLFRDIPACGRNHCLLPAG